MEEAVRVVEERLPGERADDEVARHLRGGRQGARHAKRRRLARRVRGVPEGGLEGGDDGLVADADGDGVTDLAGLRLLRRRLDLVRFRKGRR